MEFLVDPPADWSMAQVAEFVAAKAEETAGQIPASRIGWLIFDAVKVGYE